MSDNQDALGALLDAYLDLLRSGTAPSIEAYADQYPASASELRETLPILLEMEQIGNMPDEPQSAYMSPPDFDGTDFRFLRKIGSGGMGVVYEALQVSLGRKVAIKILSPARAVEDAALNRLENEARVIAQLYHPNIVKVYTAGHHGGTFFYAMELLESTDLARQPPSGQREIAQVGVDASRALAYAHGCGVLHCDIKPSNLFRGADGILKIGDFGLALSAEECGEAASVRDGTLRYMAPERLAKKRIEFASDQYSLGATLYEFLARQPLRHGTNPPLLAREIQNPHVRFPSGCDQDLAAIIAKSLSVDPSDRYPSMSDLADDLQRYLDHRPVLASRPSAIRRLLLWARRDPFRAAACAFTIVCAAGFMVSMAIGLVNTRRAMEQARKNAVTANNALQVVFRHVARQPPSPSDALLLKEILPYYENLSDDAQLTDAGRAVVYESLVKCAMRIGKYDLAEKLQRQLMALGENDADGQSRLAVAVLRQGRKDEAASIWNAIAARFSRGGTPDEQAVAARALISAADDMSSPGCKLAFDILRRVLEKHPENQKARLEYARMLIEGSPFASGVVMPGVPSDPVRILDELVAQNPQRLYYAVRRMKALYRQYCRKLDKDEPVEDEESAHLLAQAEDLFARYANHPGVASLVYHARRAYLDHAMLNCPPPRYTRRHGQFVEFCRTIFSSPDIPGQDKAEIVDAQLEELGDLVDSPRRFGRHAQMIRDELDKFSGQRAKEFEERLRLLQEKVPADDPNERRFAPRRHHWKRPKTDDIPQDAL